MPDKPLVALPDGRALYNLPMTEEQVRACRSVLTNDIKVRIVDRLP